MNSLFTMWRILFVISIFISGVVLNCVQRGCNEAGLFYQTDNLDMLASKDHAIAWRSKFISNNTAYMSVESDNAGCVTNGILVACPYWPDNMAYSTIWVMNVTTGEFVTEMLWLPNAGMPILTEEGDLIATNSTHICVQKPGVYFYLSELNQNSVNSTLVPVYLPEQKLVVVAGNMTTEFTVWRYTPTNTGNRLTRLIRFNITTLGMGGCPYIPVTQLAARDNRIYFYAFNTNSQIENRERMLAVEINEDGFPRVAWAFDPASEEHSRSNVQVEGITRSSPLCIVNRSLPHDHQPGFPPNDVSNQVLVTPNGTVFVSTSISLLVFKDNGESATKLAAAFFGVHYLAYSSPTPEQENGMVWMSGWSHYPSFKAAIVGMNESLGMIIIHPLNSLNASDMNITSHITSFDHPVNQKQRVLVFSAEIRTISGECRSVLVALLTSNKSTSNPTLFWMYDLPALSQDKADSSGFTIKGQIVAAENKLIFYMSDGKNSRVFALK